ncbi:MAG: polysaccharide biosynthesis tyrosine autokinase [Candidatus Geothermincolales bacterium]
MELRDYITVVLGRKWVIIGSAALVIAAALIISFLQTPLYESRVKILAESNKAGETATDKLLSLAFTDPNSFIQTQQKIIETRTIAEAVRQRLESLYEERSYGADPSGETFIPASIPDPEELMKRVKVERAQNTNVFDIVITTAHPLLSRDIAQAYADEYIKNRQLAAIKQISEARKEVWNRIQEVQNQIEEVAQEAKKYTRENRPPELEASATQAVNLWATLYEKYLSLRIAEALEQRGLEVIEPAKAGIRVSPKTARNGVLAVFLGLILGIGLAFLVDYLDNSLKSREDFERFYETAILAEIPRIPLEEGVREAVYITQSESPAAEGFRNLRTHVMFINLDEHVRAIMVTSSSPKEGKTSVAFNLGAALSEMGKRVLLIEADLRRPALQKFLEDISEKGLVDVIMGHLPLEEAISNTGIPNLDILVSGPKPPNPAEMVSSSSMQKILERCKELYDFVLVDVPPVLAVSDAVALAPYVDGVLLVASHGIATREGAKRTVEILSKVEARILGVVVNNVEISARRYGYGYYGYYTPYHYYYSGGDGEERVPALKRLARSLRGTRKQ